MCHVSPVSCHVSPVQIFFLTNFTQKNPLEEIGQNGGASQLRAHIVTALNRFVKTIPQNNVFEALTF